MVLVAPSTGDPGRRATPGATALGRHSSAGRSTGGGSAGDPTGAEATCAYLRGRRASLSGSECNRKSHRTTRPGSHEPAVGAMKQGGNMKRALLATILLGLLVLPIGAQSLSETPHSRELPFSYGGLGGNFQRDANISDAQMRQIGTIAEVNRKVLLDQRSELEKRETELQAALEA